MDIAANNWTETDGSNTSAAPDGAPEGMAPSGLNDVLRAHQGAMKRWYNWTIPKVTAGTSTAYTLTYGVAPGALVDGMTHLVQFHAANGNPPTLNVNSLGAIPLYYHSSGTWRPVPAALWDTDEIFKVAYHASSGTYRVLRPGAEKTGTVKAFAGPTVPGGYLLCFGQAISRTAYAGLFAVLGGTHGNGDGSTTFNLPDLRARVAIGKDDMGGLALGAARRHRAARHSRRHAGQPVQHGDHDGERHSGGFDLRRRDQGRSICRRCRQHGHKHAL